MFPKLIYSAESSYNKKIEVYQKGDKSYLSVDDSVQSVSANTPSVKNRYWGKIVGIVKTECSSARKILLLGLAGGTIPHLFAQEMPEAQVTAVEIDKVMIGTAKNFFDLESIPNLSVINADAFLVLAAPSKFNLVGKSFDVAVVDLFYGDKYPELGNSGAFFANLKNLVKPGGFVIFNRRYLNQHQEIVGNFVENMKKFFSDVKIAPVAGISNSDNILIYGRV